MSDKKSVFLDANILYSWNLNHLFMFFCDTGVGLIEPYWSDLAVTEAIRNIKSNTGDDATSRFEQMNKAYPYSNVTGYESLGNVKGVDPKDQDIAKAAIFNECDFLVTNNLKHFKQAEDLQTKPKALTADSMLRALSAKYPEKSLKATALAWWHCDDAGTFDEYLAFIGRKTSGLSLVQFENSLRELIKKSGNDIEAIKDAALAGEEKRYGGRK